MGKKNDEEKSNSKNSKILKPGKERLSVSATLASMDRKLEKPKSKSSFNSKPKPTSYVDDLDLPPSDSEEDDAVESREIDLPVRHVTRAVRIPTNGFSLSVKEEKKRERKDVINTKKLEQNRLDALCEDRDAFAVMFGYKTSVVDGEHVADANMKDITIENFSVSAKGKELLKNASVKISHGKKYGLVGPNGKGKSTLLKLLAWRQVPVPKNIDVLLVEQEVVGDEKTVIEAVISGKKELMDTRQEVERLKDGGGELVELDYQGDRLVELYERLQIMSSDTAEVEAAKILRGLSFTKDMMNRQTKSFSGGWRMRIAIAQALFVHPTLLLLDEPTNHLDLRAVLWLEDYLCRWKTTLVVVSHDRDFLNSVCNEIIHLHDLQLHAYRGNFDDFETGYDQKKKEMNKKHDIYEKQIKAAKRNGNRVQQEKIKDQAKDTAARDALKAKGKGKTDNNDAPIPQVPRKWRDYSVEFHFPEPTEQTPPLELVDASFTYPNRGDFRLSNISVGIDMGTRVAIVGPNGAGKSTLLNLLAGDLQPTEGEVRRSQKLRVGRYSQHFVDLLVMEVNPVQYLLRLHPEQEGLSRVEAVRALLGKFGLPGHNHLTPIAKLSGGQKARVVFTSISMSKPHVLILDEPTNHLDMQSIDALAEALEEFSGGVVLVSHDSRLISRVCENEERSQIWVVEDGIVKPYLGSFDEYKEELLQEIKADANN